MNLQLETRRAEEVHIVDIRGRVTIGPTNDLLSQRLRELVDAGAKKILINLADTIQVDSSAISTIVRGFVSLSRTGGDLKLLAPQGRVREVLMVTHLLGTIPAFDDEAKALASFR
jgi:anti-sigma B factor antagonist